MGLWQEGSKHIIKCKSLAGRWQRALLNAFALLSFFWVQDKGTQSRDCLWQNKTAGLLPSNWPYITMAQTLKCKLTTHHFHTSYTSVLFAQRRKTVAVCGHFESFNIHKQTWLLTFVCQYQNTTLGDMMFPRIGEQHKVWLEILEWNACEAEHTMNL